MIFQDHASQADYINRTPATFQSRNLCLPIYYRKIHSVVSYDRSISSLKASSPQTII